MEILKHHKELKEGIGKCSMSMWSNDMPSGFCNKDAFGVRPDGATRKNTLTGKLERVDGKYCGYIPHLACPEHGGPKRPPGIKPNDRKGENAMLYTRDEYRKVIDERNDLEAEVSGLKSTLEKVKQDREIIRLNKDKLEDTIVEMESQLKESKHDSNILVEERDKTGEERTKIIDNQRDAIIDLKLECQHAKDMNDKLSGANSNLRKQIIDRVKVADILLEDKAGLITEMKDVKASLFKVKDDRSHLQETKHEFTETIFDLENKLMESEIKYDQFVDENDGKGGGIDGPVNDPRDTIIDLREQITGNLATIKRLEKTVNFYQGTIDILRKENLDLQDKTRDLTKELESEKSKKEDARESIQSPENLATINQLEASIKDYQKALTRLAEKNLDLWNRNKGLIKDRELGSPACDPDPLDSQTLKDNIATLRAKIHDLTEETAIDDRLESPLHETLSIVTGPDSLDYQFLEKDITDLRIKFHDLTVQIQTKKS